MIKRLRHWAVVVLAAVVILNSTGCSTIYHWDRTSMPKSEQGNLDVGMLLLDILWIPVYGAGLVGLLIDFLDGTMYIPKSQQPWEKK